MPRIYKPQYRMGNQTVSGKEGELIATVTAYENRKAAYFESGQDIEGITLRTKTSPDLVNALQMQFERLKSRGLIYVVRGEEVSTKDQNGKLYLMQHGTFWPDGDYHIGYLRKRIRRTVKYRNEQGILAGFTDKDWHHYFVKQEPGEVSKVSSVDRMSGLMWPWGRVQFYQMAVNLKKEIRSFYAYLIFSWFGSAGLLAWIGFMFYYMQVWPSMRNMVLTGLIISEVAVLLFWSAYIPRFRDRVKSYKVLEKIRQQWPGFCMEKFVAMAGSRLKCMFYADTLEKIGEFVSCDLIDFLYENDNVVNCETNSFRFEGLSEDENYWYVDVCQRVILTRDLECKMERKGMTVKLRFMKIKDSIMSMDFYKDWYISKVEVCR